MTEIRILPIELLLRLFSLLSLKELKIVVLVCKLWRDIGEDPNFWISSKIGIFCREDIKKLHMKRLQHKEEISVRGWLTRPSLLNPQCRYNSPWTRTMGCTTLKQYNCEAGNLKELFEAFDKLPKLKCIEGLYNVNLSSLESGLLAKVFTRLETVDLGNNSFTSDHIQALFAAMSQNTQLKGLHFTLENLSCVDPDVLASIVAKLEYVQLDLDDLTAKQLASVLDRVTQGETKLWKLWLIRNDSDDLDLEIVRKAREKLGKVGPKALLIDAGPEGIYDIFSLPSFEMDNYELYK